MALLLLLLLCVHPPTHSMRMRMLEPILPPALPPPMVRGLRPCAPPPHTHTHTLPCSCRAALVSAVGKVFVKSKSLGRGGGVLQPSASIKVRHAPQGIPWTHTLDPHTSLHPDLHPDPDLHPEVTYALTDTLAYILHLSPHIPSLKPSTLLLKPQASMNSVFCGASF